MASGGYYVATHILTVWKRLARLAPDQPHSWSFPDVVIYTCWSTLATEIRPPYSAWSNQRMCSEFRCVQTIFQDTLLQVSSPLAYPMKFHEGIQWLSLTDLISRRISSSPRAGIFSMLKAPLVHAQIHTGLLAPHVFYASDLACLDLLRTVFS
jgi:hypothetical protein